MTEDQIVLDAKACLEAGEFADAWHALAPVFENVSAIDVEYRSWVQLAERIFAAAGWHAAWAASCLYLKRFEPVIATAETLPPRMRACALAGAAGDKRHDNHAHSLHAVASNQYELASQPVHAALHRFRGGDFAGALRLWSEVLLSPRLRPRTYEVALTQLQLGRTQLQLGNKKAARTHLIEAQVILEDVAERLQSEGQNERAFDCYIALLEVGRLSGSFENIAEGYLNCIAALKVDHLRSYVLRFYEDFIASALEAREHLAAALALMDAAEYCHAAKLPYERDYASRAGDAWLSWAMSQSDTTFCHRSLLHALDCFARGGDFDRLRQCYERLIALEVDKGEATRYVAERARLPAENPAGTMPRFFERHRRTDAYPEVWTLDLIEWDLQGDPERTAEQLLIDDTQSDLVRRRALLLLYDVATNHDTSDQRLRLIRRVGSLFAYTALSPLELFFDTGDAAVRAEVCAALAGLFFKRSFAILARGIVDVSPLVRTQAIASLAKMSFTAALSPLQHIYRTHPAPDVKRAIASAVARVKGSDAEDLLRQLARDSDAETSQIAIRALSRDNQVAAV